MTSGLRSPDDIVIAVGLTTYDLTFPFSSKPCTVVSAPVYDHSVDASSLSPLVVSAYTLTVPLTRYL